MPPAPNIAFCGEEFAVADSIGLMALMRFAKVAKTGMDHRSLEALAVMLDLIEQCIAPAEWQRFQDVADAHRADADALFRVITDAFEVISDRPTSRPSDSSDGPSRTEPTSAGDSFSRAKERLERQGRPDLALMVLQAQEQQTA